MSWVPVSDAELVARLFAETDPIGGRFVVLAPRGGLDFEGIVAAQELARRHAFAPLPRHQLRFEFSRLGAEAVFEIAIAPTAPCVVVVREIIAGEAVGVFAWSGRGGRLKGSTDDRIRHLANQLEAEFLQRWGDAA